MKSYLLLWFIFFGICFGIGYSPLNRYNPRLHQGLSDAMHYGNVVTEGPRANGNRYQYRVLVPLLSKFFYDNFLKNKAIGSWDPVALAFLIANSIFVSITALLLVWISRDMCGRIEPGLFAAFLFLGNLIVINYYMAMLIDSSEALFCFLLVIALYKNWLLLAFFLMPIGVLAKESTIPLFAAIFFGWIILEQKKGGFSIKPFLLGLIFVGLGFLTFSGLRLVIDGQVRWPWEIFESEKTGYSILNSLRISIFSRTFWYLYIWLLPLAFLGCFSVSKRFLFLGAMAFLMAIFLVVSLHAAGYHAARLTFNAFGPVMCLSGGFALRNLCEGLSKKTV